MLRVGDGTTTLLTAAAPAFLERYKVSDGSMVGTALALDGYTANDKLKDVDPVVIATAADKTAYRGVALAPM